MRRHVKWGTSHTHNFKTHQLACLHIHMLSRVGSHVCTGHAQKKQMHKLIKPREAAGLTLCTLPPTPPQRESSKRATLPGCRLCLPPPPTRPFLMKLDFLSCSVIPPILSTGVLYNSLMVIVTNKSSPPPCFLPRLPSHTLT